MVRLSIAWLSAKGLLINLFTAGVVGLCTLIGQAEAGATSKTFTRWGGRKSFFTRRLQGHFGMKQGADKPPPQASEVRFRPLKVHVLENRFVSVSLHECFDPKKG